MNYRHVMATFILIASGFQVHALTLTLDNNCYQLIGNVTIDDQGNITATSQGACGRGGGDNPGVLTISPASASVTEGGQQTFTIQRSGGTTGLASVEVQIQEVTTSSQDYTISGDCAASNPLSVSWNDGDGTNRSCIITAVTDSDVESDETLTLQLANPTGATLGNPNQATLTITDATASGCPTPGPNVTPMALDWQDRSTHTLTWQQGEVLAIAFTTDNDTSRRGKIKYDTTTAGASSTVTMAVSECPGDFNPFNGNTRCKNSPGISGGIYYTQGDPQRWQCSLPLNTPLYLNITSDCPAGKTCAIVLSW